MTDGEPLFLVFGNLTRTGTKLFECFDVQRLRVGSRTCQITNKVQIDQWAQDCGAESTSSRSVCWGGGNVEPTCSIVKALSVTDWRW